MDASVLRRMLRPLGERLRLVCSRAVVRLSDDTKPVQSLQVERFVGEVSEAERFQEYGFTSHPEPGAEAAVLSMNGDRSHAIVVAVEDRRYRIQLPQGATAIYDRAGSKVVLDAAGNVTVTASGTVTLDSASAVVTGDLQVNGSVTADGDVSDGTGSLQANRDAFNLHTHTGNLGAPTGPPSPQQ